MSDEKRQRGAVTDYRPDDDRVSGGADKSVQSEALGAEGSEDLAYNSSTSGGAAGRVNTVSHNPTPNRAGGERDDEPADITR
jgi:hypothetical protein